MKKFLMSCAALSVLALPSAVSAADLAVRPAPVVVAAPSWTGCYVGIHAGAAWGDKWWADRNVWDNVSYPTSGWLTGVQLGCDLQAGPVVVGAEATWSWTNVEGNGVPAAQLGFTQFHSEIDSLTTLGGRVGLVADKALIFVKVAAAWADETHTLAPSFVGGLVPQSIGDTRFGVVLGAGIEYMIAPILTAKLEYNFIDFGTEEFFFNSIPLQVPADNRQNLHLMKLGVSYKFW